jgi:dipeptidase E
MGFRLTGIHEYADARKAIETTDAIFVGGGNTFVLLSAIYENGLMGVIRERVAEGMPYIGASAGTNVAGATIKVTNDNPIVYPPSFNALGLVPFIFKPHYLDPDPNAKHTRETDETRIKEYHMYNSDDVVGLREGAMLHVTNDDILLLGSSGARIFYKDKSAEEYMPVHSLAFLLRANL